MAQQAPPEAPLVPPAEIAFGDFDNLYGKDPTVPAVPTDKAESRPGVIDEPKTPLEQERDNLEENAKQIDDPAERKKFLDDLQTFEDRAKEDGLREEEIRKTYENLNKLLEANDGKLPKHQNIAIAEQIAHHLANPSNIDQGGHLTCNVTTLQERMFTTNPATATDMIVQGALTGQYVAADGKVIKLDPSNYVPGREELDRIPQDGSRSNASQIFQAVALNDIFQRQNPPLTYVQGRPGENGPGDSGERLVNADGKVVANFGGLGTKDMNDEAKRLIGEAFCINNVASGFGDGPTSFKTEQEMIDFIKKAQAEGDLPLSIVVDANHPLFGAGIENGGFAGHVVSITDYNPATGQVKISNQWGSGGDKWVSAKDLYAATTRYVRDMKHEIVEEEDWWEKLWPF